MLTIVAIFNNSWQFSYLLEEQILCAATFSKKKLQLLVIWDLLAAELSWVEHGKCFIISGPGKATIIKYSFSRIQKKKRWGRNNDKILAHLQQPTNVEQRRPATEEPTWNDQQKTNTERHVTWIFWNPDCYKKLWDDIGGVKQKSSFEHAQNVHLHHPAHAQSIIPLLSIHTFCSIDSVRGQ